MLKFFMMVGFMIPFFFSFFFWGLVQNMFFLLTFLFLFNLQVTEGWGVQGYFLGVDSLSNALILLSFWLCSLMILASFNVLKVNFNTSIFVGLIVSLLMFLYLTFSSMSMLLFYIFFEASLIPTLFLIVGWGYQPERLQAGLYLLFYTLLASLPLLMGIFFLYKCGGSLEFLSIFSSMYLDFVYIWFYFSMVLAFLVKMPMFLLHLWLPKAHVEAPVAGSMILAGVLLKLGGYGLLRVLPFMNKLASFLNIVWIIISLFGGVVVSLVCLRQSDLKSLIAYSSVAHMGLVLSGLMTMNYWGLDGCMILMIGHGLCSSGLFALANICYERLGSRSMLVNKGLLSFMPTMTMWWFLLSSCSMAAPPSLNLAGEISLINGIVCWSNMSMYMLILISFFSVVYTLYMYSSSQHGSFFMGIYACCSGNVREYLMLWLHWFPLNYLILGVDFCIYLLK
uniref:NADH-ubiquinone oxidoreductase chain 4 n=1 Tax=Trigoniophthalmus alternatus TaxID=50637 RepID=B2BSA7_9INSE|nr:NADH dehydrogenase subunit 4 [Trigoniophthalmus alternatus]ABS57560.1 NADH dehydrogenase subunit 4 [Trigoniophthalmus alternatus]